jgi:hypothetical protein
MIIQRMKAARRMMRMYVIKMIASVAMAPMGSS